MDGLWVRSVLSETSNSRMGTGFISAGGLDGGWRRGPLGEGSIRGVTDRGEGTVRDNPDNLETENSCVVPEK